MTVTSGLALEVHAANRTGDMALAHDLVLVERVIVIEVFITYLAVIVLNQLVLTEVP